MNRRLKSNLCKQSITKHKNVKPNLTNHIKNKLTVVVYIYMVNGLAPMILDAHFTMAYTFMVGATKPATKPYNLKN